MHIVIYTNIIGKFGILAMREQGGSKQGTWSENRNIPTRLKKETKDKSIRKGNIDTYKHDLT